MIHFDALEFSSFFDAQCSYLRYIQVMIRRYPTILVTSSFLLLRAANTLDHRLVKVTDVNMSHLFKDRKM